MKNWAQDMFVNMQCVAVKTLLQHCMLRGLLQIFLPRLNNKA